MPIFGLHFARQSFMPGLTVGIQKLDAQNLQTCKNWTFMCTDTILDAI